MMVTMKMHCSCALDVIVTVLRPRYCADILSTLDRSVNAWGEHGVLLPEKGGTGSGTGRWMLGVIPRLCCPWTTARSEGKHGAKTFAKVEAS